MSDTTKKRIHLIYGAVLSAMLILTGSLLIASCVSIYRMGDRPFTHENISGAFSRIAILVWITVGAVIIGAIIQLLLPIRNSKSKTFRDKKTILARFQKKLNTNLCSEKTLSLIRKEQKLRLILRTVAAILCVVAAIPAVLYALNFSHFNEDLNKSVISACVWIIPCTIVILGICMLLTYFINESYNRQIELVKAALAESKKTARLDASKSRSPRLKIVTGFRIVLTVVALVFVIVGIFNGGMADVLTKAINICTECIGLG